MASPVILVSLVSVIAVVAASKALHAQATGALSCDEFLPAKKQVAGKTIGPDECRIVSSEVVVNLKGQKFQRLEVRVSGNLEGWASKAGPRADYFNDVPDIVFTQSGNKSPRFRGIGRYRAETGHGFSLFVPESRADWNGKLFITAHGAGAYGAVGTVIDRNPSADFHALTNSNRYVGLMLDRGYAVAHTLRSSQISGGDVVVTLEDGSTLKNNVSTHTGFITGMARIAGSMVQQKLGRPERTYYYGFSAGGFLGRLVQYVPGINRGDDGRPLFDGFLLGDSGAGLWLPVLMVDGKDMLFVGNDDRARFVPQIDISHQLYLAEDGNTLNRKRQNAQILRDKGLGEKHRMYEIRAVSHMDAGQVSRPELVAQTLDLGGINEALVDLLDRWVVKGEAPPPSKSDLPALGGNENPAIALPEAACPLGVYYVMPAVHGTSRRSYQETAFAAFDGADLEPLDGRGQFVDMNGNGVRDQRETVVQAWTRIGLLKSGERLTHGKYAACVAHAAARLVEQGLLPTRVLAHYVNQAKTNGLGEVER
jgi:Alpha/beta hydrolase domain